MHLKIWTDELTCQLTYIGGFRKLTALRKYIPEKWVMTRYNTVLIGVILRFLE